MKKKKYIIIAAAVILVLAGLFILRSMKGSVKNVTVETVKLGRGTISNTITATGTLEAVKTVQVGTQVSGVIEKLFVDFNTEVKKGQVLAKLDEKPLITQLEQSKANVDEAEAEMEYQKANYDRYKVLSEKNLIAQSDYDLVVYNYKQSVAALKNAKSVYDKNKINLDYATIYSPIDGIIENRAVDEGQTVAASFNTPTLFTIANDLTQMRVEAKVDEADIGQVKVGQRVEFTVDAYPNLKFNGSVTEIRIQPVTTNNVVTYTVIIGAPNKEKKLMPGMTTNITIFVNEKTNILVIPGKATRFTPDQKLLTAYYKIHGTTPKRENQGGFKGTNATAAKDTFLWLKNGVDLEKVKVHLGETDGINYELVSGLNEGDEMVVAMKEEQVTAQTATKTARSPFMPQRPGSSRR